MTADLAASFDHCGRVARRSASSFYYSFLLLPRAKREAMFALYAFLRRTDDIGDAPAPDAMAAQSPGWEEISHRRAALSRWRDSLAAALEGRFDDPCLPALADTVARYAIPIEHLTAVIDGVEMDLAGRTYETFAELELYCRRVASAVGLACLHVWGFSDSAALEPARQCGLAFQLTNVLRDLKEDADRGRVYLPLEDLRRFGYSPEELRRGVGDERFLALLRFEVDRTERYFAAAAGLDRWLEPECRGVFRAMFSTYRGLLEAIRRAEGQVLRRRIQLSGWRKLRIAARQWWRAPATTAAR